MAIRRAKQKAQVIEKLSQMAPPGEQFIACVHVETGPSPWLNAVFEEIPGLVLIIALTRNQYFLTLTNTSVVVNAASRWTNRPGDVLAVFPRHAFPISRVKRRSIWSSAYLQLPTDSKPKRINIHRYWRNELDMLSAAFPPGAIDPSSQPFENVPQDQPFPPQGAPMGQPFPPQGAPMGQPPFPPQGAPMPPMGAPQGQPPFPPQGAPVPPPFPQQGAPVPPPMGAPMPPQGANPYAGQPGQPGYAPHPDQM
ncbi:hypothetical protein LN042_20295 [Kitasatospora sp. RB6PN24]|uniref:hypothetical protein n=1 Tax=Kitasatospora humi TaxID=2893891 RepID=UPI001E3319AD|nr:hypothetical protein [Kitasatospora humi]MCC9309393.1 hypothetical protein [Kitasatospora humi]